MVDMPKMEFLEDNIKTFENFKPLNKDEYDIIDKVVKIINDNTAIPCTYCRYCVSKCPKKIAIPDYFALYNDWNRLRNSAQNEVMLNSCASGTSVVNIDNGFGAGFLASRINHMGA